MSIRISDMPELTASINNSSSLLCIVDNTESDNLNKNKKITFNNFLSFISENYDINSSKDLIVSNSLQIFGQSSYLTQVRVYRNLTINASITVSPLSSCFGVIFICTGDFVNNGTINMTGTGVNTSSIYPYNLLGYPWTFKLSNPVANSYRFSKSGSIWTNLINSSQYTMSVFNNCGNGGNGGAANQPGGKGGSGSIFGGGGGGGGGSRGFSPNPTTPRGIPGDNAIGIAGGAGGYAYPIYSGDEGGGGGGAGTPSGTGGSSGPLTSPTSLAQNGGPGVGGSICFVVKGNFTNNGSIISNGSNGGSGGGPAPQSAGGGGGSGGGSISIIYGGTYVGGTLNVNGGSGGSPNGGAGNAGTISANKINFI